MTTHVFIVGATTFKLHLEYLFAGTGAQNNRIDFNNSSNTTLHHTKENMLVAQTDRQKGKIPLTCYNSR